MRLLRLKGPNRRQLGLKKRWGKALGGVSVKVKETGLGREGKTKEVVD